ncbi:hypothetical protein AC4HA13_0080 [Escherichia phage vB_EcoM_4HA13]|uniref:Uncharacterized protein n=1 Tax=Escherichia phage vB_EcoM_4HA13 TaxID=2601675 RepID=A0A8F4TDJ1_9CAUD|nr:hypothetical protein HYP96_gp80 [Escherichia phage vB_EcoM_4HA13]QXG07487.1 hypothetical protein AC4HA13_0080 [Escherichia phage vB_EcoM_4HA13]
MAYSRGNLSRKAYSLRSFNRFSPSLRSRACCKLLNI